MVVIKLEDKDDIKIVAEEIIKGTRIWAVYGFWESNSIFKIYVASSNNKLIEYKLEKQNFYTDETNKKKNLIQENEIELIDWPREIRHIEEDKKENFIIACENGDIKFFCDEKSNFNDQQIFRSIYALKSDKGDYNILTGSDNNKITFFENNKKRFTFKTLDRVRETIIYNEECLAVSEDRYLYVIDKLGYIKWRYRFPHRALCIDTYVYSEGTYYIVGCGDGSVYFLTEKRVVKYAYRFPDRIRDVKVFNSEIIIIACEASHIYFCPTMESLIKDFYGGDISEIIDDQLKLLKKDIDSKSIKAIKDVPFKEKLLLLDKIDMWYLGGNSEIFILLCDSCKMSVLKSNNIKIYYIYANALITLATRIDFAVGKSRIRDYLSSDKNPYILHSILSTITQKNIKGLPPNRIIPNPIELLEFIVTNINFKDKWILEETILTLYEADFFSFIPSGFIIFFKNNRILYRKLYNIKKYSCEFNHKGIKSSPLLNLIDFLETNQHKEQDFENIIKNCHLTDKSQNEVMKNIEFIYKISIEEKSVKGSLGHIKKWISERVSNDELKKTFSTIIIDNCTKFDEGLTFFKMVKKLLENDFQYSNYEITAVDFLHILFSYSFINILSFKFDR